ncbi:MAG: PemK-like protein [Myxococcaceae bacterium]|nr:PemK-like protein [Myxococcaceae bacterium]
MRQYELWWARLAEPAGRRPVLLLQRNGAAEYLNHLLVAEITTQIRGIPQELALGKREGLDRRSVANFDSMRLVSKERLASRIGSLHPSREVELKRAVGSVFGWPELDQLED